MRGGTQGIVELPVYVASSVVGPAGPVYATAVKNAHLPMQECLAETFAAAVEIPFGPSADILAGAIKGSGLKEALAKNMIKRLSGGSGEVAGQLATGDTDVSHLTQAFVIGGGLEGNSRNQFAEDRGRPIALKNGTELRSPIMKVRGEERYAAVVRNGNETKLFELPKDHQFVTRWQKLKFAHPALLPDQLHAALSSDNPTTMTVPIERGQRPETNKGTSVALVDRTVQESEYWLFSGRRIEQASRITLGRNPDSDLQFERDTVSRKHAVIEKTTGGALVRNVSTSLETYVNGKRVGPEGAILKSGDRIRLGPTEEFTFQGETRSKHTAVYAPRNGVRDVCADQDAVRQSNRYKAGGEITERVHDGFQTFSGDRRVSSDGQHGDIRRPSAVIDRFQDLALCETISEAHQRFDSLKSDPKRLATELAKFCKEKMQPKGWTEQDVNNSYYQFRAEHKGERILIGDYIRRAKDGSGAGVCQHQALLFKVLADDFGLDASLIRGHYGPVPKGGLGADAFANHAWNEVQIDGQSYVFDPRQERFAIKQSELKEHVPFRDVPKDGNTRLEKYNQAGVKPGDVVTHGGKGWRVSNETSIDPGKIVLRVAGQKTLTEEEFNKLNSGRNLRPGEKYEIERSSGKRDLGWTYVGKAEDGGLIFLKKDALRKEVYPHELAQPGSVQKGNGDIAGAGKQNPSPRYARQFEKAVASTPPLMPFDAGKAVPGESLYYDGEQFLFVASDTKTGYPILFKADRGNGFQNEFRRVSKEQLASEYTSAVLKGDTIYRQKDSSRIYKVSPVGDGNFDVSIDFRYVMVDPNFMPGRLKMEKPNANSSNFDKDVPEMMSAPPEKPVTAALARKYRVDEKLIVTLVTMGPDSPMYRQARSAVLQVRQVERFWTEFQQNLNVLKKENGMIATRRPTLIRKPEPASNGDDSKSAGDQSNGSKASDSALPAQPMSAQLKEVLGDKLPQSLSRSDAQKLASQWGHLSEDEKSSVLKVLYESNRDAFNGLREELLEKWLPNRPTENFQDANSEKAGIKAQYNAKSMIKQYCESRGWVVVMAAPGSGLDRSGVDFMLIDLKTSTWLPLDVTLNDKLRTFYTIKLHDDWGRKNIGEISENRKKEFEGQLDQFFRQYGEGGRITEKPQSGLLDPNLPTVEKIILLKRFSASLPANAQEMKWHVRGAIDTLEKERVNGISRDRYQQSHR